MTKPGTLRNYNLRRFGGDLSGGVVAALIALPYGLAMASLMGVPPVMGLFTSILTSPVTAMLGRNPVLIGGPSTVTAPFVSAAVAAYGIGGAAKISIAAAVFMMMFSILRWGRFISMVPLSVVSGFSCGIGAMMIISQVKSVAIQGHPHGMILAAMSILLASASTRFFPHAPAPMSGVAGSLALGALMGWKELEVGSMQLAIPPLATFSWSARDVMELAPSAFALAVVATINLLITSRVVEHFRGSHPHLKKADADREIGAYSIANLFAGMFGAPLSVGIPARSLANVRCGATTRLSIWIHAAVLVLMLTAGSSLLAHIPIAALAGITAWMGICLLDWSTWKRLPMMRRIDAGAFVVTFVSAVAWNAAASVALGCLPYLLHAAYERMSPRAQYFTDAPIS